MENYNNNNNDNDENTELHLKSAEWMIKEADKLLIQYKECKTAHAQSRLLPRLEYMLKKLSFEKNEVKKLIDNNE